MGALRDHLSNRAVRAANSLIQHPLSLVAVRRRVPLAARRNDRITVARMLRLLIDTCALLDLARDHQGRRLIEPLRNFQIQGWVDVLVPQVIVDEFDRNKPAFEASMTRSVSDRFKYLRSDLIAHGLTNTEALRQFDELAREIPIVGAMAIRNFLLIRETTRPRDQADSFCG